MSNAARIAEILANRKVAPCGGNYLVRCPAHRDDSPSLSLRDGDNGLIVHCFAGCAPGEVYAAIRRIDHGLLQPGETAREPVKGSTEYERRQHEKAAWLWSRRQPISGTLAETYLREARRYTGPLPPTLAFLPPSKAEHHPAMIAAFTLVDEPGPGVLGAPKDVGSVHLTLLKTDGSGKADAKPDKIIVGSPCGRPIVVAPVNDLLGLVIVEGIEDALSAYLATGLGAWAAGSGSMMGALADAVPDYVTSVVIEMHPDSAGRRGAYELAGRLRERRLRKLRDGEPERWRERPIKITVREATS